MVLCINNNRFALFLLGFEEVKHQRFNLGYTTEADFQYIAIFIQFNIQVMGDSRDLRNCVHNCR